MDIDTKTAPPRRRRRGQAMVEFALGLFAAVLLLSGLFAAGEIMTDLLEARGRVRAAAGAKALVASAGTAPRHIRRWDEGADGLQYTPDDRAVGGVSAAMSALVRMSAANERDFDYPLSHDALPFSMLGYARGLADPAAFAKESETVVNEVPPFAAKYLFGSETVRNRVEVSMPVSGGLL